MNIHPKLIDNGGRRSGLDRRKFSYTSHIPERRFIDERRGVQDRRSDISKRMNIERRVVFS